MFKVILRKIKIEFGRIFNFLWPAEKSKVAKKLAPFCFATEFWEAVVTSTQEGK